MVAFAANSVLNRLALAQSDIGPAAFAAPRLGAGVLGLAAAVVARGGGVPLVAPGRRDADPLAATAANFAAALPAALVALALAADVGGATAKGIAAAVVSGALTSGLATRSGTASRPRWARAARRWRS
jgi:hypothetical protein